MRALVGLIFLVACGKSAAPPAAGSGSAAPPAPLPRAPGDAAVVLAGATPVAVVVIGAHGELSVADWTGALPARSDPVADVAAMESAIIARAKKGDGHDTMAVAKWREKDAQLRAYRDRVDEREQEVEFAIPRSYFGHFPAGLDPKRPEDDAERWEQLARLPIARSESVDRVPPLAPLIASVPDAPAIATVQVAQRIGGAVGVMVDGKLGVLKRGFRWAIDTPADYHPETPWVELRASASGVELIDFAANKVTPVAWGELASLAVPQGIELADVLVAPDLTAQRLVDLLAVLRAVRWANLAEAPPGTAADRLAHVREVRHADRMERRVTVEEFQIDGTRSDDSDGVIPAVRAELPALRSCYDERRPRLADPNGGVGLVFVLAPSGAIGTLDVQHDDKPLADCVRAIVTRVKFPAAKKRREVSGLISFRAPD